MINYFSVSFDCNVGTCIARFLSAYLTYTVAAVILYKYTPFVAKGGNSLSIHLTIILPLFKIHCQQEYIFTYDMSLQCVSDV